MKVINTKIQDLLYIDTVTSFILLYKLSQKNSEKFFIVCTLHYSLFYNFIKYSYSFHIIFWAQY